jgi:formylglycine-generating enzyme required for sulfatase activity
VTADPVFDRLARALAGRYALTRELGRGGMATVYLATDVKLGRQVAIKVLAPAMRAYLGGERFEREVRLVARLSHPHIVPLFEAGEAGGLLYYAMEYVEGESLRERLAREGPLPVAEAAGIAAEVADALQYAHDHGVIHRDVKPANILLSRGHALVTDFGVAKLLGARTEPGQDSLTGTGFAPGTAEYMSPEQAAGERRIDARSDVYALAAVLYEMLAGAPPFTAPTAQAVVARILVEPPPRLRAARPGVPPHVERTVARGLAKRPDDRPPTARAFAAALAAPPRARAAPWRRPPVLLAGGAALAAALAWKLFFPARPRPAHPAGMVRVPAGAYPVGGDPWREPAIVRLDSFDLDSTEVTVAAFARYLAATGRPPPWTARPPERWPVTGVLWAEAAAYCAWREPGGRLPTEDEWEAAARGPRGWRYPWGERWERGRANADSLRPGFAPVGTDSAGRSWVGAVDLIGNAWEWTATAAPGPPGEPAHVIKGGAFDTPPERATAAFRAAFPERRAWLGHTGFRCARAAGP